MVAPASDWYSAPHVSHISAKSTPSGRRRCTRAPLPPGKMRPSEAPAASRASRARPRIDRPRRRGVLATSERRRRRAALAASPTPTIRSRDHLQRQLQVVDRARQRTHRAHVANPTRRARRLRDVPRKRHAAFGRLQAVHAAVGHRNTDGPLDVAAMSSGERPAATAAALPPDEPPGVRARSHGLLVRPKSGLAV